MFHLFTPQPSEQELPQQFTFPFSYLPHPLSVRATMEVEEHLVSHQEWKEELQEGKMFGVLIVRNEDQQIGFLAAFSGLLTGSSHHPYFVPPVFDWMAPEGYFKKEELKISEINQEILLKEHAQSFIAHNNELRSMQENAQRELSRFKDVMKQKKEERDALRQTSLDPMKTDQLIRESQFLKAEYKRLNQLWTQKINHLKKETEIAQSEINTLKKERKERSAQLQMWLFDHFRLLNANGESKGLKELFAPTPQRIPPAGAGECAGPKLLQYAYVHRLEPLAMAEFWWGNSPKGEIRRHGEFYPSCKGKCEPILRHMLVGLNVEANPYENRTCTERIEILYEDEYLLVTNKPSGMLSVPGKSSRESLLSILQNRQTPPGELYAVHRLDMNTSGILIFAKNRKIYANLQAEFQQRKVNKKYIALLEGIIPFNKGTISLPIAPNYNERPRQMIDFEQGKEAISDFEVISIENEKTRIAFYPITGRTHQLRLHAAHSMGLGSPIIGDELYGHRASRLMLHAERIEFIHPITKEKISIEAKAPF